MREITFSSTTLTLRGSKDENSVGIVWRKTRVQSLALILVIPTQIELTAPASPIFFYAQSSEIASENSLDFSNPIRSFLLKCHLRFLFLLELCHIQNLFFFLFSLSKKQHCEFRITIAENETIWGQFSNSNSFIQTLYLFLFNADLKRTFLHATALFGTL